MNKPLIAFLVFVSALTVTLSANHHEGGFEFDRATPESQGLSSQAILDFIQGCEEETDAVHSFIIWRHGKLVSEGWWAPHGPDTKHIMHSMSKAFTSTAIGFAIEEGLFSLDDTVVSFFPEKAPKNPSNYMGNIRIRQLLTMSTGHLTSASNLMRVAEDGDWVKSFFEQEPEMKPGSYFLYNSGATYMLSAILQKVTGEKMVDYLKPRLFEPLGIENVVWEECPMGINVGGWGMFITTEDILKLGVVYSQKGMWEGERLLSEDWVALATSKQVSNGYSPNSDWDQGYGYKFWQSRHGYRGDGKWGQFCFVLPEQDAVIAVTSGNSDMQKIMNLVWDNLLAGMGDKALPESAKLTEKLKARSAGLNLFNVKERKVLPAMNRISKSKYVMKDNHTGVDSMKFSLKKGGLQIQTVDTLGSQKVDVGFGSWNYTELEVDGIGTGPQKVAIRGAWLSPNTIEIYYSFYERCLLTRKTFQFEGDALIVEQETSVDYFSEPLPRLVGVVE